MVQWLGMGNEAWLIKQVEYYCTQLERAGKYALYLWPPHCILGSDGHPLVGVIHEARMFHAFARHTQSFVESKGYNALTENYSVLGPEVRTRFDGHPLVAMNSRFVETLLTADAVVIAGQASSHCVKSSIDDLLGHIARKDTALARKVYILADCMSAVTVPDGRGGFLADFTSEAEEALRRFADAGMHVVTTNLPLERWEGLLSRGT